MSAFSWFAGKFGYAPQQKGAEMGGSYVLPWQSGKPYNPSTLPEDLINRYTGWVYTCASKNSISAAQIPLRLYGSVPTSKSKSRFKTKTVKSDVKQHLWQNQSIRKYMNQAVDVEEIVEHPFLDLMYNANDFMNGFDLLELLFLHQELTGNTFWHITKDPIGKPIEIWPLYPQHIKIITHKQKFISGFEFSINSNEKIVYEPEEVVHFYYANPHTPIIGLGRLQAVVIAADMSTAMGQYETALMQNMARPDKAIILPAEAGNPNKEDMERLQKAWYKRHGGIKKAGKVAFLTGGAKIEDLSLSPRELNYLQGRKATLEEIAGVFGVPMSKVTTDNVNRANAESGEYQYMKDTILPMLRRTEQKMNEKLLPMFDAENIFVAFDNPVPQDRDFRLKERESNIKSGYSNINEERQEDGRDDVEWGDIPLLPMNLQPLGTELPQKEVQQNIPEPKPEPKKQQKKIEPLRLPSARHNIQYETKLKTFFINIREDILSKVDESKLYTKSPAADLASGWFDMEKWNKELAEISKPFVRNTYFLGGKQAIKQVQSEFQFEPIAGRVENVMEERTGLIVDTNKRTASQLRNVIEAHLVEGKPRNELKKTIQEFFDDDYAGYRAKRISRTETIWAFNHGAVEGYRQSRVVRAKEWLVAGDDRLCEWCSSMDGKIVEIEDDYFNKGDELTGSAGGRLHFDYEPIGHPPLHPNCRCTIIPVLKEE
jgi:HK97 family phage portal protein